MIRSWIKEFLLKSGIVEELVARASSEIDTYAKQKVDQAVKDMQTKYSSFFFPDASQELSNTTAADLLYLSPKDKEKIGGCSPMTCEVEMENAYVLENWDKKIPLYRITSHNKTFRVEERDSSSSKVWRLASNHRFHFTSMEDVTKDFMFHVCYRLRKDFVEELKKIDENSSWEDIDPDAVIVDKMEDI